MNLLYTDTYSESCQISKIEFLKPFDAPSVWMFHICIKNNKSKIIELIVSIQKRIQNHVKHLK